ncbi:hypothetical protein PAECIP111891_03183 [Paenibacillus allorhizoplanae]|uniref:Ankyrin repeat domain-containing protein n=1 Tax=Paenibacillus allorhizoplanae TaxID=2905648 RepID=A0ABM9CCI0_9BACL|nr:ankyrin repeat domain-containing protein [Paenibacillus allorhizoplanae]CAH1208252.1 hypothetical protein PAECIP111891_03183 [Paenibacillus allorhizoplanae]
MKNNNLIQILANLRQEHGVQLFQEPRRLKGLLIDYSGGMSREINLLATAVQMGIALEIDCQQGEILQPLVQKKLSRRLQDDMGIAQDYADWTIRALTEACGKKLDGGAVSGRMVGPSTSTAPTLAGKGGGEFGHSLSKWLSAEAYRAKCFIRKHRRVASITAVTVMLTGALSFILFAIDGQSPGQILQQNALVAGPSQTPEASVLISGATPDSTVSPAAEAVHALTSGVTVNPTASLLSSQETARTNAEVTVEPSASQPPSGGVPVSPTPITAVASTLIKEPVAPSNTTVAAPPTKEPVVSDRSSATADSTLASPQVSESSTAVPTTAVTVNPEDRKALSEEFYLLIKNSPCCVISSETIQKMENLLKRGADPNYVVWYGWPILLDASAKGLAQAAELLLKYGADVNIKTKDEITSIYVASTGWTVKVLLQAGADVNSRRSNGNYPLDNAISYNNKEVIKVLLEAGAKSTRSVPSDLKN